MHSMNNYRSLRPLILRFWQEVLYIYDTALSLSSSSSLLDQLLVAYLFCQKPYRNLITAAMQDR